MSRYDKNCSTNLYKEFITKSSLIKLIKFETRFSQEHFYLICTKKVFILLN